MENTDTTYYRLTVNGEVIRKDWNCFDSKEDLKTFINNEDIDLEFLLGTDFHCMSGMACCKVTEEHETLFRH